MENIKILLEINNHDYHKLLLTIWFVSMGCDILLGILASIKQRRLSSSIAEKGILKKIATVIFVLFMGVIANALKMETIYPILIISMIIAELQSITELLYVLEVPWIDKWIQLVSNESIIKKMETYGITLKLPQAKKEESKIENTDQNKESKS